jgi:hypothetical protein
MKINPSNIFTPWGWSKDIVELLWDYNIPYQDNYEINKYINKVQEDIHYQCVIFALFENNNLLVIDCCDASDWEIKINYHKHIYLKLQYNPNYHYTNRVFPFTYLPYNPKNFAKNIYNLQQNYSNTPHDLITYGRWIAVSLERYNLAKKMRSIGINYGGEYCLVKEGQGYDDHAAIGVLDPFAPRHRLSFDEYMQWVNRSKSVLDCRGFGEFTHRMIESFGIKVPLIRPRMQNITFDPLIPNTHYIDCGPNGDNLENALNILSNNKITLELINNSYEWYNNNSTPEALKNRISYFIEMLL